jgi:hypothetical protein
MREIKKNHQKIKCCLTSREEYLKKDTNENVELKQGENRQLKLGDELVIAVVEQPTAEKLQ